MRTRYGLPFLLPRLSFHWRCLSSVCSAALAVSGLSACTSADADITLKFASSEARARTQSVAFTAFEPIIGQPDTFDQIPRFVSCDEVGVFPPQRIVDPDFISQEPDNLAGVVAERTTQTFPLDGDWLVDLDSNGFNEVLNPWGAVMVFVEARGDARAPESRGGGQTPATLLSGCFCLRTRDGSHPNAALDQQVKRDCQPIEGSGAVTEQEVALTPVASEAFRLELCDGTAQLTAPKNETLSPGPEVCLSVNQCGAFSAPGTCFDCEQPCSELRQRGNVPVQFDVYRGNERSPDETEIVLTEFDSRGAAQARIDVGDCSQPIRVEAHIVGRTGERATFDIDCVDSIGGFECPREIALADLRQPRAIARLPGDPEACEGGDPDACDKLAVLSDDGGDEARLDIIDVQTGNPITSFIYANEKGHDVLGYLYELEAPGRTAGRPTLAVATARSADRALRVRVYEWDFANRRLVPHDGDTGILDAPCQEWLCGSLQSCTQLSQCQDGEVCFNDVCQDIGEVEGQCQLPAPVYCECEQIIEFQTRVNLIARDLDQDGYADLAIGNNADVNVHFFLSGQRLTGTLYADNCTCGKFNVTANAFALMNIGGPVPDPQETDLVLGNVGLFVKSASRQPLGLPVTLQCGQPSPISQDSAAVRDIQAATLRCPLEDFTCIQYDDLVTVSAQAVAGGDPTDEGTVRVLTGSDQDLTASTRIPSGLSRTLVPRTLRTPPQDPQRAQVADYNADRNLDIAVLYRGSQDVHVWLGGSNGGFGEVTNGVILNECAGGFGGDCSPLSDLVALDSDGDRKSELAVVCSPSQRARLRVFSPLPPSPPL